MILKIYNKYCGGFFFSKSIFLSHLSQVSDTLCNHKTCSVVSPQIIKIMQLKLPWSGFQLVGKTSVKWTAALTLFILIAFLGDETFFENYIWRVTCRLMVYLERCLLWFVETIWRDCWDKVYFWNQNNLEKNYYYHFANYFYACNVFTKICGIYVLIIKSEFYLVWSSNNMLNDSYLRHFSEVTILLVT